MDVFQRSSDRSFFLVSCTRMLVNYQLSAYSSLNCWNESHVTFTPQLLCILQFLFSLDKSPWQLTCLGQQIHRVLESQNLPNVKGPGYCSIKLEQCVVLGKSSI